MAPKKKTRNNKAKNNQEETPRRLPTISCEKCGQAITVPRACRHGKKLINCQGTGCTTAHIKEHNAICDPVMASPVAAVRPRAPMGLSEAEITTELDEFKTRQERKIDRTTASKMIAQELHERVRRREESLSNMTSVRLAAMGILTQQLNTVIKHRGGKPARYIEGLPFTEWLSKLEKGPILRVDEWTDNLKDVIEGRKTVGEIGYDDEESEVEGDACPTPENDD